MNSHQPLTNSRLAYLAARLGVGISLLMHGGVRVPTLPSFANGIAERFSDTMIGGFPTLAAGYLIPLVEVWVGLAVLIGGGLIRWGLASGIVLMGMLMFGTCILQKWDMLVSQMLHLTVFYLLLLNPHVPEAPASGSLSMETHGR